MEEEVIDYLYNWATSDGFKKSKEDFVKLLQTNDEVLSYAFDFAQKDGFKKDKNALGLLVGRTATSAPVATTEPAKTETVTEPTKELRSEPMTTVKAQALPEKQVATPTVDMAKMPTMEVKSVEATPTKEEPMTAEKKEAVKSDIESQLLPVTESTVIKEVPTESDKMVIKSPEKKKEFLEAADEVLYQIYNSPGYLQKLENEISQSKDFNKDYDPKVLEELNARGKNIMQKIRSLKPEAKEERNSLMNELDDIGEKTSNIYEKLSLIGGTYKTSDLINERRKRVETSKVNLDEDGGDSAGAMRRSYTNERPEAKAGLTVKEVEEYERKLEEFTSKEQPLTTDIYLFPEIHKSDMYKTNEYPSEDYRSDLMATTIEEKEHSSHVPLINPKGIGRNYAENITPYAVDIVKENAIIDDAYLNEPTEVIAKKRATEVNLIGRGLLNPGENVDESHFKELLKSPNIPFNITQLLQAVSGIEVDEENAIKATKKIQDKILNDPKLYKETLQRWLNIMNKIAVVDKRENKTFDINPFGISKTKTG